MQRSGILLLFSVTLYFILLSFYNGRVIFFNLKIASGVYAIAHLIYILIFFLLTTHHAFRYKFLYKIFILSLLWVFTATYLSDVGVWTNHNIIVGNGLYRPWLLNLQTIFLCIYAAYSLYSFITDARVKCPNCKKLNDFGVDLHEADLLDMDTESELTHGRVTVKGELDRRYNSEIEVTNTYFYKGVCKFCETDFEFSRKSSYTKSA